MPGECWSIAAAPRSPRGGDHGDCRRVVGRGLETVRTCGIYEDEGRGLLFRILEGAGRRYWKGSFESAEGMIDIHFMTDQ
jgi:hypothetical protein